MRNIKLLFKIQCMILMLSCHTITVESDLPKVDMLGLFLKTKFSCTRLPVGMLASPVVGRFPDFELLKISFLSSPCVGSLYIGNNPFLRNLFPDEYPDDFYYRHVNLLKDSLIQVSTERVERHLPRPTSH